jgi:NTP pyrophosphatase (non-canonical NTP hydrolase)
VKLNELVVTSHEISRKSGWYDGEHAKRNIGEMLMLIVTEVAEAMEDYRTGNMDHAYEGCNKPVGFASEIADIVVRVGDLCGYLNIDLEQAVSEKMFFNASRGYRHGNKKA